MYFFVLTIEKFLLYPNLTVIFILIYFVKIKYCTKMFRKKEIKIYFFVLPSMFCSLKKENFTLSQHYFSCIFELLKVLVQPPFQISKTMCNLVQPPNTKKDCTLLSIKVKIMPRPKHQVLKRQPLWLYWLLNVVFFI